MSSKSAPGPNLRKDELGPSMEVSKGNYFGSELYCLLLSKLNYLSATQIKDLMMQDIGETIDEVFKLDLQAANRATKTDFFAPRRYL